MRVQSMPAYIDHAAWRRICHVYFECHYFNVAGQQHIADRQRFIAAAGGGLSCASSQNHAFARDSPVSSGVVGRDLGFARGSAPLLLFLALPLLSVLRSEERRVGK